MWIDWQNVQIKLKSAGKFLSETGMAIDPTWKFWMIDQTLWYVWTGRATMELPQGRIHLKPGTCLWLRPGFEYRHRQDPTRPLGMYSVHFDLMTTDGRPYSDDMPLPPELLTPPDPKYVEKIIVRLAGANPEKNIWSTAMTPMARKLTINLVTALLMELDRTAIAEPVASSGEPPYVTHINEIFRRLRQDPSQFKSVSDMARELRYSRSHFTKLFQEVRAVSPGNALIRERLRQAAHMLLETDLPIKNISERLGYCDISFFTRQFRKDMGMSPARYRKRKAARLDPTQQLHPFKGSDK